MHYGSDFNNSTLDIKKKEKEKQEKKDRYSKYLLKNKEKISDFNHNNNI